MSTGIRLKRNEQDQWHVEFTHQHKLSTSFERQKYYSLKVSRFNNLLARLRLQSRPIIVGARSMVVFGVNQAKRFKALERENIRLKRLVAEKEFDIQILNETLAVDAKNF